ATEAVFRSFGNSARRSIPGSELAKQRAGVVPLVVVHEVEVTHEERDQLVGRRFLRFLFAGHGGELPKQPRIHQRSPADGNGRTPGEPSHRESVGDGANVSIADDGNVIDGGDSSTNAIKIDAAPKSLLACSTVNCDRSSPF